MCGIIGYIGKDKMAPIILDCLSALQYRGYDSSGLATVEDGHVICRKGVGAVEAVNKEYHLDELSGSIGIGHVRWATHGRVSIDNAHPHLDCKSEIAIVHNGIINNYQSLKQKLERHHCFKSETDTEVISHLLEDYMAEGACLQQAVLNTTAELEGSYAIVTVSSREPDKLVAAKRESPLVVGIGKQGYFIGSDVVSLLGKADRIIPLEDDEIVVVTRSSATFYDRDGNKVPKRFEKVDGEWLIPSKNGHDHYMLKEIFEEPDTIEMALHQNDELMMEIALEILRAKQVVIIACGTSRHAALVGRYLFSNLTGIFCEVVMAAEFEYFSNSVDRNTVVIAISQSGETADVLAGVKMAKSQGARVISMVNVPGSSLARMSDRLMYLNCGPEVSVAATKSFIAQLVLFYLLTYTMLNQTEKARKMLREIANQIKENMLTNGTEIRCLGEQLADTSVFYFLARGINFAIALEGALKMKEVSYIHAEGMPAAELKHGTLALIDKDTPVLAICPVDNTYSDTISNAMETKSRGAFVIGLSDQNNEIFDMWIKIPKVDEVFYPLVTMVPLQLLAYYAAIGRGKDPDRPRNLAKSVTVR